MIETVESRQTKIEWHFLLAFGIRDGDMRVIRLYGSRLAYQSTESLKLGELKNGTCPKIWHGNNDREEILFKCCLLGKEDAEWGL